MDARVLMAFAAGMFALAAGAAAHAAKAPPQRARAEVEAALAKAPKPPPEDQLRQLNVVLLAGKKDHGPNEHDYPLWQKRWKVLLGGKGPDDEPKVNCFYPEPEAGRHEALAGAPKVKVATAWNWPTKEQLQGAQLIVMFCAPRWNPATLKDLEAFLARGGGFVMIHVAIWHDARGLGKFTGLTKQKNTKYRHGPVELELADHPITLGLPSVVRFEDETYYNFQGDRAKVTIIGTCDEKVGDATRPEPMFWCRQVGKGRVFVCILGHNVWTFDDPFFRLLLLRGMAWAAGESPYRFDGLATRGAALR